METNYPSSGSKGSAGIPGTGTTGGTAGTTGSSASSGSMAGGSAGRGSTSAAGGMSGAGTYDDIGSTSSTSQSAAHSGGQSGAWSGAGEGGGNLREELSSLKRDLDDLISRATQLSDRELSDARDRMMAKFGSMRSAARGMADQARTQLNQGMDVTSDYVRDKPLQSVAIAAGVGLVVGALMRGGRD